MASPRVPPANPLVPLPASVETPPQPARVGEESRVVVARIQEGDLLPIEGAHHNRGDDDGTDCTRDKWIAL
jgi:hypothetical protein